MPIQKILHRILNSAVSWSFGVTLLRLLGFIVVLPVVLRNVSSEHLGMWYLMLSITQFVGYIDMGFGQTIGRFTSYFYAGVKDIPQLGQPKPAQSTEPYLPGMRGLIAMAQRYYGMLSLLMLILMVGGAGSYLWWKYPKDFFSPLPLVAFIIITIACVVWLKTHFWFELLLGINRVKDYHKNFLVGMLGNYIIVLVGVMFHWGIAALALGQLLLNYYPRAKARKKVLESLPLGKDGEIKDIAPQYLWPITWRAGLIVLSYFFFNTGLTLIGSKTLSLEVLASLGLSIQLALMIQNAANAWYAVKLPEIIYLKSQGKLMEARQLIARRTSLVMLTYITASGVAWWLAPHATDWINAKTDFLPRTELALLFLVLGLDIWTGMYSTLLMTNNFTPHLKLMMFSALANIGLGIWASNSYGLIGLLVVCAGVQLLGLTWRLPQICSQSYRPA